MDGWMGNMSPCMCSSLQLTKTLKVDVKEDTYCQLHCREKKEPRKNNVFLQNDSKMNTPNLKAQG